jgi:predicted RNA-binding protein YlqC (UPF0109 family)
MSEIDQQFIEYVVKSLVGHPDAVQIKRSIDEKGVLLELTVDPEDLGRVIGKRGATAQSLRTLLRALGTKNDARYNLKIIDNGTDGGNKSAEQKQPSEDTRSAADESSEPEQESSQDSLQAEESSEEPEAPAEEPEEPASDETEETEEAEADETSDRLAKSRKELADLDD